MKVVATTILMLLLSGCVNGGGVEAAEPVESDNEPVTPEELPELPVQVQQNVSEILTLSQVNAGNRLNSYILGPDPNCIRFHILERVVVYNISILVEWIADTEASKSLRLSLMLLDEEGRALEEKILTEGEGPLKVNLQEEIEVASNHMISIGIHPDAPGVAFSQDAEVSIGLTHGYHQALETQLIGCTI